MNHYIVLLSSIIVLVSSATLGTYKSAIISNPRNGIYDLVGLKAECPYTGAMKTVQVIYTSSQLYYQMQCYSSNAASIEYDESVIKVYYETKTTNYDLCTDNRFIWLDRHQIVCTKDFALSSFYLEKSGTNCRYTYTCVAVKSTYEDVQLTNKATSKLDAKSGAMTGLTTLKIGDAGSNRNALHNFRLQMDYTKSTWEAQYYYGIITLRDMAAVKDDYLAKSKKLREENTEV